MEGTNMNPPGAGAGEMMMRLTFFWGKRTEVLFSGWPGYDNNLGMYLLALVFIFVLAMLVEWLSACKYIQLENSNHVAAGMAQTSIYAVRVGLVYMLMLAVMSFNAGVFLIAVAGHAVGFFFLSLHRKTAQFDLPQGSC